MQFHDVNRYIGLCLVKNNYCSVPGIGTLRLKKTYAESTGFGELVPTATTVVFEAINSVDDQFAHFIGMQENISSNNASNMLGKFGKAVKQQVLKGDAYVIEGLGKFVKKGDELGFEVNNSFEIGEFVMTPPNPDKPAEFEHNKVSYTANEPTSGLKYSSNDNVSTSSKSAVAGSTKWLIPALLVTVLLAAGYGVFTYLNDQNNKNTKQEVKTDEVTSPVTDTTTVPQATGDLPISAPDTSRAPIADTATKPATDTATASVPAAPVFKGPALKVAILSFATQAAADAKCKKLVSYGNPCIVQQGDSTKWNVVVNLPSTDKPAEKVIDSLRRMFNPGGKVFAVK
jgi:hypothetical protein